MITVHEHVVDLAVSQSTVTSCNGNLKLIQSCNLTVCQNMIFKQSDCIFLVLFSNVIYRNFKFHLQSGAIKDLQGHLISRASAVDQLRVDLQNMEVS